IEAGHFFGHDLRQEENIVYVLDLSGSMSSSSGSVVEDAGTDAAAGLAGGFVGGFAGRGAGRAVKRRVKKLKKKVEKVKMHLIASLAGLPEGSQFNVIMFADGVQKLAPGMIPANGATKIAVSAFVDKLNAGGSTNMYKAVEAALYTRATHIIVLTDGLPTSSTPEAILDLVERHNASGRVRVSTVGVGADQAYEFLNALAVANQGEFKSYN
ncbi:MAG: VWA domain-containing protein, partial [Deltaproteobacteria bacterium]|nr:VWA domain-containing protein [Deltaproteobacteria bacterium]